jgi:hypothetical protein
VGHAPRSAVMAESQWLTSIGCLSMRRLRN